MNWNPVTDTGGARGRDTEPPRSDFRFDLGGALARLGLQTPAIDDPGDADRPSARTDADDGPLARRSPPEPQVDSLPTRQPSAPPPPTPPLPSRRPLADANGPATPLPTRRPAGEAAAAPDPLPTRRPAADVRPAVDPLPTRGGGTGADASAPDAPPAPGPAGRDDDLDGRLRARPDLAPTPVRRTASAQRSVFEEQAVPPTLPPAGVITPTPPPPARPGFQMPPTSTSSTGPVPTLPSSVAAAPPPIAASFDTGPSTPDIHALRSAQLRATRSQRQGRLFGRSLLAFLVLAGLVAGSMLFGRAYLFPAEWDPTLTSIVDDIQRAHDAEFSSTVPLVVQPPEEFARSVSVATIGDGWVERLPEWRALGIASGDADVDTVAAQLTTVRTAAYDPSTQTIYQLAGADAERLVADLRLALEAAFVDQSATEAAPSEAGAIGFAGVSPTADIIRLAVDRAVAGMPDGSVDAPALPLPIRYEVAAVRSLGVPLLTAARLDAASLQPGDEYPPAIYELLDDRPADAAAAMLRPGERALADPVALGADDWALVLGARLPSAEAIALAAVVTADSYRPVARDATTCFVAVFETASDADGAKLFDGMARWAAAAPAAAQAVAGQLGPSRVQLEACDPGADAAVPTTGAVDALIDAQIDRLGG